MGTEEGTCWDEHWLLYGNRFDDKLFEKKKERTQDLGPIRFTVGTKCPGPPCGHFLSV